MKHKRFQYQYRQSASNLHQKVGNILRTSNLFKTKRIYQEYPCHLINSSISNNRLRYDWVVLDLHLIIECHGLQHYQQTDFSGKLTEEQTKNQFNKLQNRDSLKKIKAIEAGYTYIEIPYSDKDIITEDYIFNLYQDNFNKKEIIEEQKEDVNLNHKKYSRQKYKNFKQSAEYKERLKQNKEYRHQQYKKLIGED